jgi:hypothetical protein
MPSFHSNCESAASSPAKGAWRPLLRTRFAGRAEPLFIDANGLRSAASIWNGAQVWAELLRSQPDSPCVVVWQAERLALLQLLVAALWDGRTLQVQASSRASASASARAPVPGAWCLDGRHVAHDGQTVCHLGNGGWPDLAGPAGMSTLDMLAFAPAHGDIGVHGRQASHAELWLALGAPLADQPTARLATGLAADAAAPSPLPLPLPLPLPKSEILAPFELGSLTTPQDVLNDALLPLLRCTEVWEREALTLA